VFVVAVAIPAKADPAGADTTRTLTEKVSLPAVVNGAVTVIGVVLTTPTWAAGTVPIVTAVGAMAALPEADAGATDVSTPKPREATATSATRLKVVFVDICFLSISQVREFPELGFG
jgi:hypothetical protein